MKKLILVLLGLLMFGIPLEHKYDKLFRFYSLTLIPDGLWLPKEFDRKIYFYLSDLAGIAFFLVGLFAFRFSWKNLFWDRGIKYLTLVFLCATLSVAFSPMIAYPTAYIRLLQLLSPFLLYGFLKNLSERIEPTQIAKVVFSGIATVGIFEAGVGIAQYFMQGSIGLRLLGEPSRLTAFFIIEGGTRWVFDDLLYPSKTILHVLRAAGTMPHPNIFGGFMVASLLASYSLILTGSRWLRDALLISLPVQVFALFLAFSRGALFGWVIASLIFLVLAKQKSSLYRILCVLIALSPLLSTGLLWKQTLARGGILNYQGVAKGSDQQRLALHNQSLVCLKKHPWLGVGYQQYSYAMSTAENYVGAPHNIYLYLACETGLLSLFAFLMFIGTTLKSCWSLQKTPAVSALIALFTFFLFVGCFDFYPLLSQQGKMLFFPLAGLLMSFVYRNELKNRDFSKEVWRPAQ